MTDKKNYINVSRGFYKALPLLKGRILADIDTRYTDNGSNVLAVAHVDTVFAEHDYNRVKLEGQDATISGALDDRLGVWIILDLLPLLGINVDILLTDGEESGKSTAKGWKPTKSYNWVVEFDRHGLLPVCYEYLTTMKPYLDKVGIGNDTGSYSDISELGHLGIGCVNWGIGYNDEHRVNSYAIDSDVIFAITAFIKFYNNFQNQKISYIPVADSSYSYGCGKNSSWKWADGYSIKPKKETKIKPLSQLCSCDFCQEMLPVTDTLFFDDINTIMCNVCAGTSKADYNHAWKWSEAESDYALPFFNDTDIYNDSGMLFG